MYDYKDWYFDEWERLAEESGRYDSMTYAQAMGSLFDHLPEGDNE